MRRKGMPAWGGTCTNARPSHCSTQVAAARERYLAGGERGAGGSATGASRVNQGTAEVQSAAQAAGAEAAHKDRL